MGTLREPADALSNGDKSSKQQAKQEADVPSDNQLPGTLALARDSRRTNVVARPAVPLYLALVRLTNSFDGQHCIAHIKARLDVACPSFNFPCSLAASGLCRTFDPNM